jgi:hypothetical protein
MLGAVVVGEVIALDNELPKELNNPHAHSKELTEEPCLRQPGTNAMFCSVLDVPDNGQEVGQLVENVINNVKHTLVGVVMVIVCHAGGGGNGGRGAGGDVVDGWFLLYGREEDVWCLVHTRGCERRGQTAVTRRFVYIPVLIMPWNQFLRDI